jgi:hypothetical protein
MALITAAVYSDIRAAIDISLDDTVLPDSIIALDLYAGAAEREVLSRDADALTRTGADLARVTTAAVLFAAARLAPAIPNITAEESDDVRYTRQAVDWAKRAADLRALAEIELQAVLAPSATTPSRPTMFARAMGGRGR